MPKATASRKSHSYYEGSGKGASYSDPDGSWDKGGPTTKNNPGSAKGQYRKKDSYDGSSDSAAVRRGRFE
jgi:hypothetical protein